MKLNTDWSKIERRLLALEFVTARMWYGCNCKPRGESKYHTAADLQKIMDVRCPVHEFRDLGDLLWLPPGLPLALEDQHLCTCPPSTLRDLIANSRGPLSDQEHREAYQLLEYEFSQSGCESFAAEQAKMHILIERYEREKRCVRLRFE